MPIETPDTGTRVYVACQPICHRGLEELLVELEFDVVGMSDGDRDVVPAIRQSRANVAVLDVSLPGLDVDRTLAELSQDEAKVRVVFASHAPGAEDVFRAVEQGAAGFVALDSSLAELRHDLDRARNGRPAVSARFEHLMIDEIRERAERSHEKALSPRQTTIVQLIADGATTHEIAEQLSISPLTVKTHYRGLYQKLGVASKAAAVAEAFRRGLL